MYKISYKTELHVGKGALQQLSHYKNEHILVVADPFLKTSGTLDAILANFDDSNDIVVFTDIVPDPPIETVVAGIKSAGDKPISIVLSIGGGPAIEFVGGERTHEK